MLLYIQCLREKRYKFYPKILKVKTYLEFIFIRLFNYKLETIYFDFILIFLLYTYSATFLSVLYVLLKQLSQNMMQVLLLPSLC